VIFTFFENYSIGAFKIIIQISRLKMPKNLITLCKFKNLTQKLHLCDQRLLAT